ncbi:hypothetical protein PAXRUDRAFT_831533 [Paxillus rubicundulus Ve08.2h10]|uniref:Uncharacterized protein n=1 Tax=Paxillus rubicundulus Ve08.2h10 TaxID=930991 RepID=A0A0D0E1T2_9AGAM|nr:hypothetical protein PAXRUDRAFT_831533 [Paxillus rubicundulus Ve08.2h10]
MVQRVIFVSRATMILRLASLFLTRLNVVSYIGNDSDGLILPFLDLADMFPNH